MASDFVFEDAIKQLDEIVATLEKGDVPLDGALSMFEKGSALVKQCNEALDKAEQKLRLLVKTPSGAQETDFEESV